MLPRLTLFEIEDLPSCPAWLRNAMTGYLQTILTKARPYAMAAEPLAVLLKETGERRVVDLASGAGGPWPTLAADLRRLGVEIELTCTDLYPNADAGRGLPFHPAPVSALAVPPELPGARTMFTALHHFSPEHVRGILASAQEAGVPFASFEASHRSFRGLLVSLFVPIGVLLLMPFVRPRRPLALLLTYLPPLVPLAIFWDGLVSMLRTYKVRELEAIAATIRRPGYAWEAREIPVRGVPIPVTALLGRPVTEAANAPG
jgi:hypothetical protein